MQPNLDLAPQIAARFHFFDLILLAIAAATGLESRLFSTPKPGVYELPASRVTKWNPGVPGGIPNYTVVASTIEAAAFGNGLTDARAAIQGALNAAGSSARDGTGRIVALSAGTFSISGELHLPSRVVLRGAGPDSTRLVAIGNNHPLVVIGPTLLPRPGDSNTNAPSHPTVSSEVKPTELPSLTTDLLATGAKGAFSVEVANPAGFVAGQLVDIDETTDNVRSQWNTHKHPPGAGRNWYCRENRPISQILEVVAVNGNTLTFRTPLHIDFRKS